MLAQSVTIEADGLSPRNFNRLAEYVQGQTGIKMPMSKLSMLEGRLRRCMRASGAPSLNAYCEYLFEQGGLEAEEVRLFDAVTTNKTDFFREPAHFEVIRTKVLPALLDGKRRRLTAWSSACSVGAEAYTLAMTFEEYGREKGRFDYSILGTDLSTRVLDQALAGIFPESMIEPVPQELRRRYLMESRDSRRREVRIIPELRAKHVFGRLNLMDEQYGLDRGMDIVFCRNVLIYFDKKTQEQVLRRLCDHLRPGGYLFLGHSESLTGFNLPVVAVANTVFQKR